MRGIATLTLSASGYVKYGSQRVPIHSGPHSPHPRESGSSAR